MTMAMRVLGTAVLVGVLSGKAALAQTTALTNPLQAAAWRDGAGASASDIDQLRQSLALAERRISDLERAMTEQQARMASVLAPADRLADARAAGAPGASGPAIVLAQASDQASGGSVGGPVGEAPANTSDAAANVVAALPDNSGVLTRPGHFVFDPSVTYSRSSSNRLVFRGVEIVTGVQIGVLEANNAARDTLVGTLALRYGLTRRAEIEVRAPYIHRHDRITTVAQRDSQISQTMRLDGSNIGDVEFIGRYQLTNGGPDKPIIVGNLRVKSDTGTSPYEVPRDQFGVAQRLAVGSGFWGVEPSISTLIVTDPAVIFANLSYMHNFKRDINKTVGNVLVGEVKPGDSIGGSVGFGFSLNPRFSFSLGYRHSYIFQSKTELGQTMQKSEALQVGSLLFGMSYRVTAARTINAQFEFGVTSDAPSVGITLRAPFAF